MKIGFLRGKPLIMSWTVGIAVLTLTFAFGFLAGAMASERKRSVKAWVGFSVMTAPLPLAPIALLLIGDRKS